MIEPPEYSARDYHHHLSYTHGISPIPVRDRLTLRHLHDRAHTRGDNLAQSGEGHWHSGEDPLEYEWHLYQPQELERRTESNWQQESMSWSPEPGEAEMGRWQSLFHDRRRPRNTP